MDGKPLILVVDDEPDFLEIISAKLHASDLEPVVAYNGKEGVDAAKKLHPDLILMDIHMPGGSGTDAALEIKQDPGTKNLKIAFLTSLKDPWPAVKANRGEISKELGMEDFIEKTEDLNVIVSKIKGLLARKTA